MFRKMTIVSVLLLLVGLLTSAAQAHGNGAAGFRIRNLVGNALGLGFGSPLGFNYGSYGGYGSPLGFGYGGGLGYGSANCGIAPASFGYGGYGGYSGFSSYGGGFAAPQIYPPAYTAPVCQPQYVIQQPAYYSQPQFVAQPYPVVQPYPLFFGGGRPFHFHHHHPAPAPAPAP